jgi:hypothetical protein
MEQILYVKQILNASIFIYKIFWQYKCIIILFK